MKRKPARSRGPIHQRIARLREEKGLTQGQLATELDVHETAVSHWENGKLPSPDRLAALADALGTTVADLISGEKSFEALARAFEAKAS